VVEVIVSSKDRRQYAESVRHAFITAKTTEGGNRKREMRGMRKRDLKKRGELERFGRGRNKGPRNISLFLLYGGKVIRGI